jgi:hypothetical protein
VNATIKIAVGDWGNALPADIHAVACSSAQHLLRVIDWPDPISVMVEPAACEKDVPMTFPWANERGEVVVRLSVRDRYWAQLAFQFSHELCHVLANPSTWSYDRFAWIEEAFCEAASIFALQGMATSWITAPPYPNWGNYADSFRKYLAEHISDPSRSLPAGAVFADWLHGQLPLLEAEPFKRRSDTTIIARELLPIFEKTPATWESMRYLHSTPRSTSSKYTDVLREWRRICPPPVGIHLDPILAIMSA